MSAATFNAYYPARFGAARFYDPYRKTTLLVSTPSVDDDVLPDDGWHLAARKRKVEDDDEEEEETDVDALRRTERGSEQRYSKRDVIRLLRQTNARVLRSPDALVTTDERVQHTTQERIWAIDQVYLVERIATQVPMVAACMSALKNLVMSDGLKFMRENVELVPSRDFADYTVRRLHPFAYACIDTLLMIGIVPVVYELDPRTGQRWPYIPAIGTYSIKRHTVNGAVRYRFYWIDETSFRQAWQRQAVRVRDASGLRWVARASSELYNADDATVGGIYDPSVEIIHNLGHELTSDGSLTSKLASLLLVAANRMRVQRARQTAEALAAAPPIGTEYDQASEAQQSRSLVQGYYASAAAPPDPAADAAETIENRTYVRDAAAREAHIGLLRYYENESGRDASRIFDVRHDEYRSDIGGTAVSQPSLTSEGTPAPWANQYHVTACRRLVRLPESRISTDYTDVLRYMDEEICGVLGVPQTYVLGTALRAGTELVTNRLADEVRALKRTLSDIMTHIYNALFTGEDISTYMASDYRRRQMHVGLVDDAEPAPLLTEDDLYVIDAIKRVRVSFAKKPTDTPQELFQLFALGGITQESLCEELARRNNFDPAQLAAPPPESAISPDMAQWLIPELAEYHKQQAAQSQHKDEMRMQKSQSKQDGEIKQAELASREKQAKLNADTKKATAAAKPPPAAGKTSTPAPKAAASKPEPTSGPSLSAISAAAKTLAAASAAAKKQKDESEKKNKK